MEFRSVDTEDAALEHLSSIGADVSVLAGGTDLVLQHSRGEVAARAMLHIGRVRSLRHVTVVDGAMHLGAIVTHIDLQRDSKVTKRFPALAEAAATVGGWQTQAAGTIGGNVCNASPAADTLPPLLVADAQVELASTRGLSLIHI